jgi:hypothetical protein
VARADVEIPERKISMTWTLRRDANQSQSTSHTIEIMFRMSPNDPSGGIDKVPGIFVEQAEGSQGTALAGLAIKVTTGYFLIGLSATPAERDRNMQLLKERQWFDVAIVYANGKRAILSMEKGLLGDAAFTQAFAAWEKQDGQRDRLDPPGTATPLAPTQSLSTGTYAAQLSSQASEAEAQASFRALQAKYPKELGDKEATLKRVEVPGVGIRYRVLVGSFGSRADAAQFCKALQTAGALCIAATN